MSKKQKLEEEVVNLSGSLIPLPSGLHLLAGLSLNSNLMTSEDMTHLASLGNQVRKQSIKGK